MTTPVLSVVICTFSPARAARLEVAVRSLERESRRPDQVVVVFDHAPAVEAWAAVRLPGVQRVAHRGRPGLSGARNTGVAAAGGDIVAFLDDDAVAEPDWVERLLAAYGDPQVVGAGGAVLPMWEGARPSWLPEEFLWVVGCSYRGLPVRPSPVRNLIGCNMSFRRSAIVEAGGFADGLGRVGSRPLGCEETDLCIRIGRSRPGEIILYDPAIAVRHAVTRERGTVRYFLARCHAEGRSKAQVARLRGRDAALASERGYLARTLPSGLRDAGFARAGAMAAGVAAAGAGYVLPGVGRPA
jgi:glucosyl-dolichyl phosphate glucuronosyltransferase